MACRAVKSPLLLLRSPSSAAFTFVPRISRHHRARLLPSPPSATSPVYPSPVRRSASSSATMPAAKRITPADVLQRNQAWSQKAIEVDRDLFTACAAGQSPPILWIGCSDSRVPESVVSHVQPGDMFVHRNIANQFSETDDSANSVLTYGVEALNVEHVIIVGHTSCGGVLASLSGAKGDPLPTSDALQRYLTPLVHVCNSVRASMGIVNGQGPKDAATSDALLKKATEANVQEQVRKIAESKVVQANWAGKRTAFPGEPQYKVHVHGWIHDISNGKLTDLGITVKPPPA